MKTEQTETCSGCQAVDELHEMTKCSKCGGWICPRCLYLPSLDAPCHCAACRSAHKAGGSVAAPPRRSEHGKVRRQTHHDRADRTRPNH